MTLRHVINMAREYLLIGGILVLVAVAAFLIIRAILAKRSNKEHKKINIKRLIWWFVFLCYIFVVLGATMLSRGSIYEYDEIQPLFYSYKSAWYQWSMVQWRNIVLNILMFVPFGLLLPLGIKWFKKFYRTFAAGFLFSLFIELTQKLLKIGIFEPDDLLNNTLGALIGFGLYVLILKLFSKDKESVGAIKVVAANIPLVLTVIAAAVIYFAYSGKELGNNSTHYLKVYKPSLLNIHGVEVTDDGRTTLPVYQLPLLSKEEARKKAEEIFERIDGSCDIYYEGYYDDEAWFRSRNAGDDTQIVIKYKGGTYEYEVMGIISDTISSFSEKEAREVLEKCGYEMPEDAEFIEGSNSRLAFHYNIIGEDGSVSDGLISFKLTSDKKITNLRDNSLSSVLYKNMEVIGKAEAYHNLKTGKFKYYGNEPLDIEVLSSDIVFIIDSKGFMQPCYLFSTIVNGKEADIKMPALKGE